ncbi:PAS domain-containing protein [Streptomyces peucetius]|uniref:PAS domain-containing protein n=1 Tax=Streptomyces peucetius TaxID=1950 RepID=A0ABY6I872_STRPE|nr:PAS domain-containing protein [Streptomyces peucetius]UYQ63196.1 PAS domain-containing protein [Streptomyces peucetius]
MSSRPSRGAARLAAILDALPDGLVLVNANGTVVNANTIALELFETPGTALVGRGLLDLLPEFDSRLIPGSMRRPDAADHRGRTKPTRMIARRTDGGEFPVEVTSASLEDGREAYDSYNAYTGDELLMLVVRDLSGTVDTEAELARSQRQTEMILRAASEGVVGTDTDGRVVLVNPAAAQILGFRASDLGGQELHPLILHSRADGEPFPYAESPLADTLKSGRKHRVRGQVLWSKSGEKVSVDLTTAPVRDGDQLVGAVMTFTDRRPYEEQARKHAAELAETTERLTTELAETTERLTTELEAVTERLTAELSATREQYEAELADKADRYTAALESGDERYAELTARHAQLTAVLGESLRGPLEQLRSELGALAADPAGQLWPEANQILHHLAAGYARMTTLVDNVLGYQRLDTGAEQLSKSTVLLDAVVTAGVEGAIELIGPGRAQFAVHAPPIEAEVDGARLATALAHLVADVVGVDSTGKAKLPPGGGYVDSTVVVAAAQRGDVVRIEVRGPFAGGDPVHEPIVRGIVRAHGGVLQTHEVPGMTGSAYVLEVPLGEGAGAVAPPAPDAGRMPALPAQQSSEPSGPVAVAAAPAGPVAVAANATSGGGGRRRARRASTDAFLESPVAMEDPMAAPPTGRRRAAQQPDAELIPAQDTGRSTDRRTGERTGNSGGTGRRRGRPSPAENSAVALQPAEGSVVTAAEGVGGRAALGETVPPQGVPVDVHGIQSAPSARRARRAVESGLPRPSEPQNALTSQNAQEPQGARETPDTPDTPNMQPQPQHLPQPTGRRARRALAAAPVEVESGAPRTAFALPPAEADRAPAGAAAADSTAERHDAVAGDPDTRHHTPPQQHPVPTGRRRARNQAQPPVQPQPQDSAEAPAGPAGPAAHVPHPAAGPVDQGQDGGTGGTGTSAAPAAARPVSDTGSVSLPLPPAAPVPAEPQAPAEAPVPVQAEAHEQPQPLPQPQPQPHAEEAPQPAAETPRPAVARVAQPLPEEQPVPADSTQGRAFSVRTLGQGVPFAQHLTQQQNQTLGSGRRRKLGTRPDAEPPEPTGRAHPQPTAAPTPAPVPPAAQQSGPRLPADLVDSRSEGRAYAIGAPDEGAEGPEPLDGPGGAVEVANRPQPQPVDDELPPEPLDNPRRLLVWPAPDVSTQQALSNRGYRPVVVHSREEVDAQIAAFPAALFVDPLTGPITRTALQSLRQAAVAAEVPVLVTAGLGQATREAAYGADPAVLLKALAPRDSEQHPSRVLLIEEHEEIALALTSTLERRGMQVARAGADADAVTLATQMRPNLVVMDLMQVRRRRAGIIDWLRANGQLNRTPLVVYTSAGLDPAELPRLSSGETVLFLAERSTSNEVQARIVDLLAKIGTN